MKPKINPLHISVEDLPLIVLSNNNHIFSCLVRWWTGTKWPHGMLMIRKGYFATQGRIFEEIPIEKFYGSKLKFRKPEFTDKEKNLFVYHVKQDLRKKKKYDYLGILGQLLRIRWLHNPNKYYCWEVITKSLRLVGFKVPARPKDLDKSLSRNGKCKVYAHYLGGE